MSNPDDAPPEPSPAEQRCPNCGAELPSGAVLCVACGYDLKEGRRLETVREPVDAETIPEPRTLEENPYLPPDLSLAAPVRKKELEKNLDLETRVFWLEERVRELERRVRGTQLTAPDFATRVFAVFAHWLMAFLAVGFCLGALYALFRVLAIGV